jgi:oligoendopeptidase F
MKTAWDLSSIYPTFDEARVIADMAQLRADIEQYTKGVSGGIAAFSDADWVVHFAHEELLDTRMTTLALYLYLLLAKDSQNTDYLRVSQHFDAQMVAVQALFLPLKDEILALGNQRLAELSHTPWLTAYCNYFVQTARQIPHYLGHQTEHALSQKSLSGACAFVDLYEQLTGDFSYVIVQDGVEKMLTESDVRALRISPDRATREVATRALAAKYRQKEHQVIFAKAYSSIVQSWVADVTLRGYSGVMDPRNESEELDGETVATLIGAVRAQYPLYHRFLRIKATLLGLKKLEIWDIFAPINTVSQAVGFDQLREWYFECAAAFDPQWLEISQRLFESGQVDVFPKIGKRGGAFAYYGKGTKSWVMLNHTDNLESGFTLAHELGHAIHGELSQVQPSAVYSSPLALAETASIFNETLFGAFLEPRLTESQKLQYLVNQLDDFFSTIFRQIMYVSFEKEVHESFLAGKPLSYPEYNALWAAHTEALYGDTVALSRELYETNWSAIPHIFHTPFYCYTYAFGNILSLELYEKYLEQGAAFVPVFKKILAAGGSKPPRELLAEQGIDIADSVFFDRGLRIIAAQLEQLEAMVAVIKD